MLKHTIALSLALAAHLYASSIYIGTTKAEAGASAQVATNLDEQARRYDGYDMPGATDEEKKLFMQKYNEKNLEALTTKDVIPTDYDINQHKDAIEKTSKYLSDKDELAKQQGLQKEALKPNKEVLDAAKIEVGKNVFNSTYSSSAKERVQAEKNSLLYGDVLKGTDGHNYIQSLLKKYGGSDKQLRLQLPQKDFLADDEALFIVVSSSLPDETILNYYKTLGPYYKEVQFVLRGVIGNDISYIRPTINYFERLRKKANAERPFTIVINPKITQLFEVEEAPAIIFLDNYSGEFETYDDAIRLDDKTQPYILYGDVGLVGALKEINRSAHSPNLAKFIDALESNKGSSRKGGKQ